MKLLPVRIFILFFPLITFSTLIRAEKSTMSKENWTKSDILLFRTKGDSLYEITRGGSLVPLSVRSAKGSIKDKVPFSAPSGQQTNLLLRICNKVDHQYTLKNIVIVPRREFENRVDQKSVLQGIFIGMMFLILLLNFILFTVAINYMYTKGHLDKVKMQNYNSKLELEKIHTENENLKLKQELDSKNRQLTSKLIELTEKETIIADIIRKLSQLDHEDVDKRKIHNLLTSLKSGQSCHNWHEFEVCFDLTHPNFYCGLDARFPKLTANDKKLCAFLKLNFSTKEMSIITGKSVNTIDVGRSRLRRKMGMVSDENLQSYIAHFN